MTENLEQKNSQESQDDIKEMTESIVEDLKKDETSQLTEEEQMRQQEIMQLHGLALKVLEDKVSKLVLGISLSQNNANAFKKVLGDAVFTSLVSFQVPRDIANDITNQVINNTLNEAMYLRQQFDQNKSSIVLAR